MVGFDHFENRFPLCRSRRRDAVIEARFRNKKKVRTSNATINFPYEHRTLSNQDQYYFQLQDLFCASSSSLL